MVALAKPERTDRESGASRAKDTGPEWESVRLVAASRRRWKWGLLAGALIVAGGAAGAWVGLAGEDTRTVAVLTADLPAGHLITAEDVASVDLGEADGLRLLTPEVAEGMVLTRPVPAGSPLVADSVSDSAQWPEQGRAMVAVPVSTLPQGLEAGTTVDLITAAVGEESDEDSPSEAGAVTGLVHRVMTGEEGFGSGGHIVEVVLPRDRAVWFSRAVAGGEAQLAVVNPHEGLQPSEEESEEEEERE
ncbi:SAF domain-containing protein [Nocardiopsis sp. FR6]|uniref:SAF domain-containing protein n=1 Tax=Nocardiopsis sp. FR6 TaxID=2605986 RepID=UPI001F2F66DB|nr:SAF domain-containing protein [Nocardiopsis sp. FR6]